MSDEHDTDLMQMLTVTDGASPPPAGAPITEARLQARLRRRRQRALAVTATVLLGGLATWTLWARPHKNDTEPQPSATAALTATLSAELDDLGSRIDRLLGDLATPPRPACSDAKELRFEVAKARAAGLLAFASDEAATNHKENR